MRSRGGATYAEATLGNRGRRSPEPQEQLEAAAGSLRVFLKTQKTNHTFELRYHLFKGRTN